MNTKLKIINVLLSQKTKKLKVKEAEVISLKMSQPNLTSRQKELLKESFKDKRKRQINWQMLNNQALNKIVRKRPRRRSLNLLRKVKKALT